MNFYADVYAWYPDDRVSVISGGGGIYYQGCIHPQGGHAVYFGASLGAPRIWKTDLSSGLTTTLTPHDWSARHPAFSWDGEYIVFASDRAFQLKSERIEEMPMSGMPPPGRPHNIYFMDGAGGGIRQITFGAHQDQRPAFSPDGKRIAFVSDRSGVPALWEAETEGSTEPKQLLENGWGYRPWYSADGQWIFFIGGHGGRHHICKIPSRGGSAVPLAYEGFEESHGPFVDPTGLALLMHAKREGVQGIWEVPLSGGIPRKLQPPGFSMAAHPTRSLNGTIVFDVPRSTQ